MSEGQPCGGKLCMDGIGVDCIYTCMSKDQLKRAVSTPVRQSPDGSGAFAARYTGQCRVCKGRIEEGDSITVSSARGAVHESCDS